MPGEAHGKQLQFDNCYMYWNCLQPAVPLQLIFTYHPGMKPPVLNVNLSLDMANLQTVDITTLHFRIWQHLGNNHSNTQLQHLATIPSIPVHKVYQHLLNSSLHLTPFNMKSSEDTDTLWNLFTHPGIYISALGLLIPSRNRIILLLFLLVSTCQISTPTFTNQVTYDIQ